MHVCAKKAAKVIKRKLERDIKEGSESYKRMLREDTTFKGLAAQQTELVKMVIRVCDICMTVFLI